MLFFITFCIYFYGVGPILILHPGRESANLVACMESYFKALDCLQMHDAIRQMVPLDHAIYKERMPELSRPSVSTTKHLELFVTFMSTKLEHW